MALIAWRLELGMRVIFGLSRLPALYFAIYSDLACTFSGHATDLKCPPSFCCDNRDVRGFRQPDCGSEHWTAAYCCANSLCYRWAEDAPGHIVSIEIVSSGVQCRHLCQASTACQYWSFIVDVPQAGDSRAHCYLKAGAAQGAFFRSHPLVVSGPRLCSKFKDGLSLQGTKVRFGLDTCIWRTTASHARPAMGPIGFLPSATGPPSRYEEAAVALHTLGFVAVLAALSQAEAAKLRAGAQLLADELLALDPLRIGNRGPRRYSFGGAARSGHMVHAQPWPDLFDNSAMHGVLRSFFPDGYVAAGGGGDFVLPHTDTFQSLHRDTLYSSGDVPPAVTVNFVVEDLTCEGGPLRAVPGTHVLDGEVPTMAEETRSSKESILCPLPAGSIIIRDLRTWHGGTPNLSNRTRYLPSIEFVASASYSKLCGRRWHFDPCRPLFPRAWHEKLSELGRETSRGIAEPPGRNLSQRPPWIKDRVADMWRFAAAAY